MIRTPLKRKTALRRKTQLARMSKKRRRESAIYGKKRKAFLLTRPFCQACQEIGSGTQLRATQVHHRFGRTGANYLDERTWLAVCSPCHEAIHQSPNEARRLGLLA